MTTVLQLVVSGVLTGSVYALMSMGLTLIFGVLRVVNFAHGEFLMIAMYGAWALTHLIGVNPYLGAVAVIPAMALFGAAVHALVIRPGLHKPHLVVVFATMGLSILLQNAALMAMTADLRDIPPVFANSLAVGPLYLKGELLTGFAVTVAATAALNWMMRRTYVGKAIRATVQDGEAAQLMGIAVPRIFLFTFTLGSALVGLAGCVMLPLFSVFPAVGLNFVLIAFVVVVLGGMGSIEGALAGGVAIGVVQSLTGYYVGPAFAQLFFFLLFLLVMLVRPNGLFGDEGAAGTGE